MANRRPTIDSIETPLDISVETKAAAAMIEKGFISPLEDEIPKAGSSYVVYEAIVDGKARYYPATTTVPRAGKFYGIRTYEDEGRSRILISHKDYNESFPFSDGPVITPYGLDNGKTCTVTIKLVDVMVDVSAERVIGVFLVVMTPSFAQIDVNAVRLIEKLEVCLLHVIFRLIFYK